MFLNLGMMRHGGFTLPGAIHTSGIYPSSRLSESYVGQCWTPDQGGVYRVAGSGYGQVRGAKLATTVAEGAILGPELIPNEADRTFSSDTGWWTKVGAAVTIGGGAANIYTTGAIASISRSGVLTIGKRFQYIINQVVRSDQVSLTDSGGPGIPSSTGQHTGEFIATAVTLTVKRYSGSLCDVDILDISIREVIPVWIAPDDYPTRSVRTRLGTAKVPTSTSVGMVSSPAFTNKVTCRKTNPTDTSGLFIDAGTVTVSIANKATELTNAGLSQMCSLGNSYRFQFTTDGIVRFGTVSTGNTNKHSIRAVVFGSAGTIRLNDTGGVSWTEKTGFESVSALDITPDGTTKFFKLVALAGADIYLICPELVESSYLPADPIVPLTPAADTLAAFTRAAIYMEEDTAGVFPVVSVVETLAIGHADNPYTTQATRMSDGSVVPVVAGASWAQNFAVFGTCVPDAALLTGQYGTLIGIYFVVNNMVKVFVGPEYVFFEKLIAGTLLQLVRHGITNTANAPFDYLAIQTIHGMALRIRPHATMTWSAWATDVTASGKKPAPIGSKYQIGALNGASGIAGKHPKVSIFDLGNQESLAAYQDRAMLLAGRITG